MSTAKIVESGHRNGTKALKVGMTLHPVSNAVARHIERLTAEVEKLKKDVKDWEDDCLV